MPKTRQESYRILQLPESATEEEVKRAYKQKARELHPDKNRDDPNATKKFQDLSEAYQRIISGKRDGEELPEGFFIDPFELFINIMLIKQMQQEQAARRRVAQMFDFEGIDDQEENFEYLNFGFGGFPFGARFSFATSSRTAYGQSRFEQKARFNNQSESYYERHSYRNSERRENSRWQKRASQDSFSQKSSKSEKRSKSKKTNESKRVTESEDEKENVAKEFSGDEKTSQSCDASVGNKNYSKTKTGTKLKKKSQQTSDAWQKGKKRNGKRGNKKQSVTITKKQSREKFDENSEHNSEMPMNSCEDFLEKEVCDKQTCGDVPEHIQECDNKPTKVDMKNSVSAFSSNCKVEKVKISDEMNECQFSESDSTTNIGQNKNSDANSETSKVQATGKENLKSVNNKLIHSKTFDNKPEKPNINEVNQNTTTMNKSTKQLENENNEGSALTSGARPKVITSEPTNKARSVFTPSKSDRSWHPKKNNRKKIYVNSKFQNLKEPSSDFRLSDSKQVDILESDSDSEDKQVIKGKGFIWKKTIKPEDKCKTQKKMTKEVSKNLSQKKNKEVEEQMKDIKSEAKCLNLEESNDCNSFSRSQNSKISVDEFFGNLKCKKSKIETVQKHRQNDSCYYFDKTYMTKPDQTGEVEAKRYFFSDKQDHITATNCNGTSMKNSCHSKQSYRTDDLYQNKNYHQKHFKSSNTVKNNIKTENYYDDYEKRNQGTFSTKYQQEQRVNQTRTQSWVQRESQRQQFYSLIPKDEEDEQRQLEMALAMSCEHAS